MIIRPIKYIDRYVFAGTACDDLIELLKKYRFEDYAIAETSNSMVVRLTFTEESPPLRTFLKFKFHDNLWL